MVIEPHKRSQVMPLPVVLISTIDKKGVRNLAPWSCVMPILRPLDEIAIASWIKRDTLNNIRETEEFVINIPTADMIEAVKISSQNFPPDVDEFEKAGLKSHISKKVNAPGVEDCLAWAECKLIEEISRKNYSLIISKVLHLEENDSYFNNKGEFDYEKAKPLLIYKMRFSYPVNVSNVMNLSI
ncbi:flavin reductase family protein [Aceticella autotrophica]|uniref:Flavin reductase family protein n=1 Tax=Aceticella autotrophica TaxID=2755338 RepID=A0A975AXF4_9THEO|nr:flavin reductase family protein [Aceticella autotrophica]QSZ28183.1 flavin reductase family protein [Aceticella autotrophica]